MTARCFLSLSLLFASAGCGARSGLGLLFLSDDPGVGGTPFQGGAFGGMAGTAASDGGKPGFAGTPAGGAPIGGRAGSGASGASHAGQGGRGTPPVVDDPTTLGDERAGKVQCRGGGYDAANREIVAICESPLGCCEGDGQCVSSASQCDRAYFTTCDGDEDCPAPNHCCRINAVGFQCRAACPTGFVRHLPCGGPCSDTDQDGIPNRTDACLVDEFEDGKGPFPEDGCSDFDGDGVIDGLDQCPTQMENGLPPKPNDGCP